MIILFLLLIRFHNDIVQSIRLCTLFRKRIFLVKWQNFSFETIVGQNKIGRKIK